MRIASGFGGLVPDDFLQPQIFLDAHKLFNASEISHAAQDARKLTRKWMSLL